MPPRRRIWVELLPPDELGAPATIKLLTRFELEPIVALPPSHETPAMAEALAKLSRAGLRVGLWPLLDDSLGYWPSEVNVSAFATRVDQALAFAAAAQAKVQTIAIDLEPAPDQVRALLDPKTVALAVAQAAGRAIGPGATRTRLKATEAFTQLRRRLGAAGIETIAAAIPLVLIDIGRRRPWLWQAILRTPVVGPSWDVVSPMLYTSMIASLLPAPGQAARASLARAILRLGARATARLPAGRSVSLGVVGPGKLGDEAALSSPAALAADTAIVTAAGIDDLALYALDGTLSRAEPEAWLAAFTGRR